MAPANFGVTASQGVPSIQAMTAKIQDLLRRADEIKPEHAIEPPLLYSDFGEAIEQATETVMGASEEPQFKESRRQAGYAIIETATRDIFNRSVASTSIDDPSFIQIWNLLDIVSMFSDNEQCEPGLIFWLIEELLDSQTIDGCRKVFDYLESRRERITAKNFKQKSLIILRSCNELLRRLSRAENTVFCGRVFIFLFQSFPLGDKSSVNLRGEYHVENTTTFDEPSVKPTSDQEQMDVDGEAKPEEKEAEDRTEQGEPIEEKNSAPGAEGSQDIKAAVPEIKTEELDPTVDNEALYPIFWSLQHYFSNPTRLFETSNFAIFKSGLESTIKKFKEAQRDTDGRVALLASDESKRGSKRKRGDFEDDLASGFNPKYLTSRDLFDLEISDLAFRRHILVQSLILLDFLQSLTPRSKAKLSGLNPQNKSVLYQHTLTDEDARWVGDTRSAIAAYLQQGPEGKFYYRMVDTVLSRDKNWVRWKAENCPPIERTPVAAEHMLNAKQGAARACAPRRIRANAAGNVLDLDFLSDVDGSHGLQMLRPKERYDIPDPATFEMSIGDDEFDIERAENEDERKKAVDAKASKSWRALRIASRSRLNIFDRIDDNAQSLKALFQPEAIQDADKEENGTEGAEVKVEIASAENGDSADPKIADSQTSPADVEESGALSKAVETTEAR